MKKRVVMVGSGMRAVYAFMPYLNKYCSDRYEIVGIFDIGCVAGAGKVTVAAHFDLCRTVS